MIPGVVAAQKRSPFKLLPWVYAYWADDPLWSNPGDGNLISSWRDGGTAGTNVTQANAGLQPVFDQSNALFNNKAAIVFDGGNDVLSATGLSLSRPFTLVVVVRFNRLGSPERAITVTDSNNSGMGHGSGNTYNLTIGSGGISGGMADNTQPHLEVGYVATANPNHRLEVDGTTIVTGSVMATAFDRILLGNGNTADRGLGGELAFAGVYVGDIASNPNYIPFKRWVAGYYGIAVS